ncbi:DUF4184 family protein [Paenibacillus xylaniclasticus]|uniref:DUF4184 family protein n=1 Tax=Paenibacillus xylaniclasticus TaxID=588083 RepID=UPI000FD6DAE1|nr:MULTISPECIES: DUF4184 family protein [Paenibacillus]GFN31805.1 hypothetical protein PCURB6_20650 [Paenibacillus curdlanolyticus]
MPFTLFHPAFAVPFRRLLPGKLVLPGIVLGSMAPDLEYFVRMEAVGKIGHQPQASVPIYLWMPGPIGLAGSSSILYG